MRFFIQICCQTRVIPRIKNFLLFLFTLINVSVIIATGDGKMEEKKIKEVIETLRPFLVGDGGDIEFVKYENDIVYINMLGACANCHMLDLTLKEGIEAAIKEEVPSVKEVINVRNLNNLTNNDI